MAIFMAVAHQMIAAAIIQGIVKEKETKLKQQLYMSGATVFGYWLGNYLQEILTLTIV